jgi:DNA-binding MarR family transcriptional regulator
MPNTEGQRPAPDMPPLAVSPAVDTPRPNEILQAVFTEVVALANQLRKTSGSVAGQESFLSGTWGILGILERPGPQTVPAMARSRALSRQNIQVSVNRLRARGLVSLSANPAHKRSALVELTDRGRSTLAAIVQQQAKSTAALLPYVTESRLVRAARLLRQLRQLLTGHELPPVEPTGTRSVEQRATTARRRPARRRQPAPPSIQPSPPPEPSEPEEPEFPVNLL